MIPNQALSVPAVPDNFLPVDVQPYELLVSYQMGGIALSDPSQGLDYQNWRLEAVGIPANSPPSHMYVSAPNTPQTLLLTAINIQSCSLAFDQNMKPAIAYIDYVGPKLWWYDGSIPGYTIIDLDPNITSVQITLDNKLPMASLTNTSDLILAYTMNNNLYYSQQRDRFTVQYLLMQNVPLANPKVGKVGMNIGDRLQFYIYGSLYQ